MRCAQPAAPRSPSVAARALERDLVGHRTTSVTVTVERLVEVAVQNPVRALEVIESVRVAPDAWLVALAGRERKALARALRS